MPVKLLSFTAQKADAARNILNWSTATEDANTTFSIERSSDGRDFSAIGSANSKGSNSTYTFYDEQPLSGTNYYRLKITGGDSTETYSGIAMVRSDNKGGSITLSPIPATGSIRITNTDASLAGQAAVIYNMQGTEVYRAVLSADERIDISGWAAGIYTLRLATGEVLRIVKQ